MRGRSMRSARERRAQSGPAAIPGAEGWREASGRRTGGPAGRRRAGGAGLLSVLLAALTLAGGSGWKLEALAETSYGDAGWRVAFTQEREMESNFQTADLADVAMGLQPGDNAVITLKLENDNAEATNWYMTNKVLSSLEDSSAAAAGGAYTYRLAYVDRDGVENVLFDSDTVGGEDTKAGEGLHEATSALEEYFYLDTLAMGQSGELTLEVALDGETQGNGYQDTLADLQMNFAVELSADNPETPEPGNPGKDTLQPVKPVDTGDRSDTLRYTILMAVSGAALLAVSAYGWKENRKDRRGGGADEEAR